MMFKEKYLAILIFLTFIISLGAVSASQLNGTDVFNVTDLEAQEYDIAIGNENNEIIDAKTFDDIQSDINNAEEGATVKLNGTFESNGSEIVIDKSITIDGGGSALLDAKGLSAFITFKGANRTVTLNGLTFTNSPYGEYGIHNEYGNYGKYRIINCTFKNSHSAVDIFYDSIVEIVGCNFTNNSQLRVSSSRLYIDNCSFVKNTGSVWAERISNCVFSENVAEEHSFIFEPSQISDCIFTANTARLSPFIDEMGSISNSVFNNNVIYGNTLIYGVKLVSNCLFENNAAKMIMNHYINDYSGGFGGVMSNAGVVMNSIFRNNKADLVGGAISGVETVKSCVFENNEALEGGAIMYSNTIIDSEFKNNKAVGYGGAIAEVHVLRNCNIINSYSKGIVKRYAMHGGGAIHTSGKLLVDNCNFIGNRVYTSGAAILISTILEPADVVISNTKFTNNVAGGKIETVGYLFKNFANGVIYNIGNYDMKIKFIKCKGLDAKNTKKFKLKSKIAASYKKKTLNIRLLDKIYSNPLKGLKVKIKIAKKTYKRTTNKNGKIKFSTKRFAPKKYTVKITFAGNNYILKSTKNMKIKVKK